MITPEPRPARRVCVRCPYCGSDDVGTEEHLTGTALVAGYDADTGEFAFTGETIVDYDSSETQLLPDGRALLCCRACCQHFPYPGRPSDRCAP
jgi:hypothetical protein